MGDILFLMTLMLAVMAINGHTSSWVVLLFFCFPIIASLLFSIFKVMTKND